MRLGLHSGRAQHREAAFARKRSRHGKQPGLADSRLAVQYERAAAPLDSIKQRSQQLNLGVPTEQRPKVARKDGHQRTILAAPAYLQKAPAGDAHRRQTRLSRQCLPAAEEPSGERLALFSPWPWLAVAMGASAWGHRWARLPHGLCCRKPASRPESNDACGFRAQRPTVLAFTHLTREKDHHGHIRTAECRSRTRRIRRRLRLAGRLRIAHPR